MSETGDLTPKPTIKIEKRFYISERRDVMSGYEQGLSIFEDSLLEATKSPDQETQHAAQYYLGKIGRIGKKMEGNLQLKRRFGAQNDSERSMIAHALNTIGLEAYGTSFNEMTTGVKPEKPIQTEVALYEREKSTFSRELAATVADTFNTDELIGLCFDFAIDHEEYPGAKSNLVAGVIKEMDARDQRGELLDQLEANRPKASFGKLKQRSTSIDELRVKAKDKLVHREQLPQVIKAEFDL